MTTFDAVNAITNHRFDRYGVLTDDEHVSWYFTRNEAQEVADRLRSRNVPYRLIGGVLVNDEGCTPYIMRGNVLEAL